jgi:hypothetical protein
LAGNQRSENVFALDLAVKRTVVWCDQLACGKGSATFGPRLALLQLHLELAGQIVAPEIQLVKVTAIHMVRVNTLPPDGGLFRTTF